MGGGLLIAPGVARAQAKAVRLGAVPAGAPRTSPHWQAFTRRLADLGYVEGRNLTIEFRNADGQPDRFPELMTELVRLGVDVLLPIGPESSLRAARAATADCRSWWSPSTTTRSSAGTSGAWRGRVATSPAPSCVNRS